jgi:hypothetical protein
MARNAINDHCELIGLKRTIEPRGKEHFFDQVMAPPCITHTHTSARKSTANCSVIFVISRAHALIARDCVHVRLRVEFCSQKVETSVPSFLQSLAILRKRRQPSLAIQTVFLSVRSETAEVALSCSFSADSSRGIVIFFQRFSIFFSLEKPLVFWWILIWEEVWKSSSKSRTRKMFLARGKGRTAKTEQLKQLPPRSWNFSWRVDVLIC